MQKIKVRGQSVRKIKDRVEIDGRTNGWTHGRTLPPMLTQSVMRFFTHTSYSHDLICMSL